MTDWLARLRENGELATKIARCMPRVLYHPKVTMAQLTLLFEALDSHLRQYRSLREQMHRENLDPSLTELAEAIQDTWIRIAQMLEARIRQLKRMH